MRQLVDHARLGQAELAVQQAIGEYADLLGVEAIEAANRFDWLGDLSLRHRAPPVCDMSRARLSRHTPIEILLVSSNLLDFIMEISIRQWCLIDLSRLLQSLYRWGIGAEGPEKLAPQLKSCEGLRP